MISIPISYGELIDKITILELKQTFIKDKNKLVNIRKELDLLCQIFQGTICSPIIADLKIELSSINKKLWDCEDSIRSDLNLSDNNDLIVFIGTAEHIHVYNDERARIKKEINKLTNSEIVEEKSY